MIDKKRGYMRTSLSSFLKEARTHAGLSQRDVADILGYDTPQFISNWERGISEPPIKSVKKISRLYKIDSDDLFYEILDNKILMIKTNLHLIYNKTK